MLMEVIQKNDDKHGSFEVIDQGKSVAQMTYTWAGPTKFIIGSDIGRCAFLRPRPICRKMVRLLSQFTHLFFCLSTG